MHAYAHISHAVPSAAHIEAWVYLARRDVVHQEQILASWWQLSFTTRRDGEGTAVIPRSGLGVSCLPLSSQCSSHRTGQILWRGLIQACMVPDSQMNSLGGTAQSCSLVLSQRLTDCESRQPPSSILCKAWSAYFKDVSSCVQSYLTEMWALEYTNASDDLCNFVIE